MLVEWEHAKIDVVQQSLKEAHNVYDNVLGVVLNSAEYYHNKDFVQYGYTD
jgi:Mrp family chromosome partitioning ATPase